MSVKDLEYLKIPRLTNGRRMAALRAVLGPRAEISRFWACSCSAAGGVETKAATAPFGRICTICPVKDAVVGREITNVLEMDVHYQAVVHVEFGW